MSDVRYRLLNSNFLKPEDGVTATVTRSFNLRCPHCNHLGSFTPINDVHDVSYVKKVEVLTPDGRKGGSTQVTYHLGIRQCPNLECRALIACAVGGPPNDPTRWIAPPELVDFRSDNVPEKVCASMKEAILSFSVQAYRASALMVRRTLEMLCEDKQVSGANLKDRISNLAKHVVISPALLGAADHLRLLGNDAAHVEAKSYDEIDRQHAEVAIDLAKEILKAVYQHDDLVSRLTKLKRS